MKLNRIGIDLAKNIFQLHGVDDQGKVVLKKKLKRGEWLRELCDSVESGCEVGMEACGGAHHWARQLQAKGFVVKVIAPQFVTPYVKSNKNDANDAEAICEAMSRPNMRFVKPKTVSQQDIQAVHRRSLYCMASGSNVPYPDIRIISFRTYNAPLLVYSNKRTLLLEEHLFRTVII